MAKGRILVVDDDDSILDVCAHTLSGLLDTELCSKITVCGRVSGSPRRVLTC